MISFEEAQRLVFQYRQNFGTEEVDLLQSLGRVLAQEITADRDFPPFDRVTMDGIAVRAQDFIAGTRTFPIEQVQAAGSPPVTLQNAHQCIEVMTGAVLPGSTDAVIPYEQCEINDAIATVRAEQVNTKQNIHVQGADGKAGDILLSPGIRITPAMVSTLATVGCARVIVHKLPRVAICSTGDELVEITCPPLSHQIRRSNVYMLAAALQQENMQPTLFHLPDVPGIMKKELASILAQHDVLLFSGAVSKGKFDFLPQVLKEVGLQLIFHKVAQKPGKPILFGTLPEGKTIFGLPGNPVSTFVCYQLFFKPWLQATLQLPQQKQTAQLAQQLVFTPALTYHLPVSITQENGILKAIPVDTSGSGDLTSLLKADALLSLPSAQQQFEAAQVFPLTWL